MNEPFRTSRRVEFGDTDMAGICHFANFFRYMEAAETDFLRSRGLTVAWQADGERLGFPRRAVACEYFKPARFEDVLTITVIVRSIGRTSVTYQFEFTKDEDLIARGTISAVCCRTDGPHGKIQAVEIPPHLRQQIQGEA
jgi:YbgC/YbaW family acyl-CoA thioester hydrolase